MKGVSERGDNAAREFASRRVWRLVVALAFLVAARCVATEAEVTFSGAGSFSNARLRSAIAEQIQAISASGLTVARADDAAYFLGAFYRREGFPKAEVQFQIRGSGLILTVKEGLRTLVKDLVFRGNRAFPDGTLSEYMFGVDAKKLASAGVPFNETEVAAGGERIAAFYISEGYIDATADTKATRIRPGGTEAEVVVQIVEGRRYVIGPISFTGQLVLESRELLDALALKRGAPFTPLTADGFQRLLRGHYRAKGFFNAKVEVIADQARARDGAVPVTAMCEPGPRFRVGKVVPRGMDRLKPEFIEKRFALLTGKVYDPAALEIRYRELVKTGMFKSLHVRPVEVAGDVLDLDVEIEEAKAKEFGVELGFASYDGVSAGLRIGDRNFAGLGRPLSLGLQYSQRGFRGELLHVDPWFLDSTWMLRSRLYSQVRDEQGYSRVTEGLRFDLGRRFAPHFEAGGYVVTELTKISDFSIDERLVGPTSYVLTAVGLTQTLDFRDDPMNPTRGWVFSASADLDALDGEIAFARAAVRYSQYRKFGKSLVGFGARAGWIIPVGDAAAVPIDLRFFNGGGTTVRSFVDRDLGPKDRGGNPLGGDFYTVFNLEWDFPIAGALGGALFADAGNLTEQSRVSLDGMRYALGAGLRYQLPIGPLRIDYGYNPSRRAGEDVGAVHLSFGFAF